ncbi:YfdQ family protein [Mangrovibacter phragmitis]|uniref:YfdQ family protein n=1 Tax=Mangrovibacter phragmitis TaxID=1691903 RepID=UPI0035139886
MSQQLDSTAIDQVRELVMSQLAEEKLAGADCPAVALPKTVNIHSLENLYAGRFRFRGQMETASIDDFVRYSTGYAAEGTRCFINADKMRAASVFNLGTLDAPGHADNTAVLALKRTAPYSALLNINGDRNSQKQLAEWLEDWSDYVTGFSADGEAIDAKKAAASVRKITIDAVRSADYEDQDFSGKRSVMESVEAKSKDIMPVAFEFKCVPYEGLEEYRFKVRMSILTSDSPVLVLRIVQLEAYEEEMAQEFRDLLVENFKDSAVETFIGVFQA